MVTEVEVTGCQMSMLDVGIFFLMNLFILSLTLFDDANDDEQKSESKSWI